MSTHNHPASIFQHGLADGCDRCDELADRPFDGMDDVNIGSLIDRIKDENFSRSMNEDNAMREVGRAMARASVMWRCGWRPQ